MKQRIDQWLVEHGHCTSREQAQRTIMAGEVWINGKRMEKASQLVSEPVEVKLTGAGPKYVSRGAHKLEKAIQTFQIALSGKVCLDAGASTGGFTDYMLQNGAAKVVAVDVGYGQLAWKLRQDPRVVVFERENIRYFTVEKLSEKPQLITADLSFISLELIFPKFAEFIAADGDLVTLIKPQFEAGRENVGKKGVVRERSVHVDVLQRLTTNAPKFGWHLVNLTFSPIRGPEGNIEYLGHWRQENGDWLIDAEKIVDQAWRELE